MAQSNLTRDNFTYPIDAVQVRTFIPKTANSIYEVRNVIAMIHDESDYILRTDGCVQHEADRQAAARIINAYNDAPDEFDAIKTYDGVIGWMTSRRLGFALAILLRAKHDGIVFNL